MGLLDAAEEIGGAIVDGASSIAAGPVQAIHFAQNIAGKAESFVEDRLGPTGNAVIGMAASLIQAPLGFMPAAAHALGDFLSDPAGFVEHVVETAESTATSALSVAQDVVDRLVKNSLAGVGVLFSGAVAGLKAIGRGLVAGVKFASAGIVEGFLLGLRVARTQAMSLLRFEAGLTKEMLVLSAKVRLAALRLIAGRVQSLIATTTASVTRLTIGAFNAARQKATALAVKVHMKATNVVMNVMPKVMAVTGKVMVATAQASARVHGAVAKAKTIIPAGFAGPLNRIDAFVRNVSTKAAALHAFYVGRVMPALVMAYQTLEKTMWPLLIEANQESVRLEASLLGQIVSLGALEIARVGVLEGRLEKQMSAVDSGMQSAIDMGVSAADSSSAAALATVAEEGRAAAVGVGNLASTAEKGGETVADKADASVREKTGLPKAGSIETPHGPQGLPKRPGGAAEHHDPTHQTQTRKFVHGVVDPKLVTSQAAAPADGDLTGPFYPDDWKKPPYKGPEDALAHNSEVTVYVNGIKTSYEAHVAAAAALAKQRRRPVVGVYNQSEGMVDDLLQCAADKVGFDMALKNAAVRQMVRIVDTYGSALDIVAHSQGSIIVSSALQIAQTGHGKHPPVNLKNVEFTALGNAIATRPKGLKDFHAYTFDNDMVSGAVGSTGISPMSMRLANLGLIGSTGIDNLALSNMELTDTDTTTLHNPRSAYRAHGVLPDKVKNEKGELVDDSAPSYITSLGKFQEKESKWRAARKAHPYLMAGADTFNNLAIPACSLSEIVVSGARGVGRVAEPYVEKGYNSASRGVRNAGSAIQSGVSSAYGKADAGLRSFGQGVEARFNRGAAATDAVIAAMYPGAAKTMMNLGWGATKGLLGAANWATGAVYNFGDKAMRKTGSAVAAGVSAKYHDVDSGIRAAGIGLSMIGEGMNWLYERATSGLASIMRSPTGPLPDDQKVAQSLGKINSPGAPIPGDVSAKLAPFVGMDASFARVHVDPEAGAAANALRAEAFATGRDIYFAPGNYDTGSPKGMSLLAHELTHVVQQAGTGASVVQHARPVGFTSDRMEAEAQAVATSVLDNLAMPNDFHVERFFKTYEASEGLGREDSQRLDRIGNMALRQVQEMVGMKQGRLDLVEVSIELDLGRMSDDEAARIWAEAIVEQIHRLPMQPKTAVPQPSLIQRSPVPEPEATPEAKPKPPDRLVVAAMTSFMRSDVDDIVGMLKANMAGLMQVQILGIFEKWKALDDKYFEETGFRGTVYLDKFIQILFNKTFNNGGIFIDRWTNGYDECYFQMADGGKDALKKIVHESKIWGSGPVTEEPESVWSYIGKRELYTGLTMVKHLSTGLSGVFDAGAWVGQKISGQKFDFSLSEYVGKSWDENILDPTAKGLGIDPNEKLIGKYSLKNVADLGGKTVSGLTMAGALLPEAGASAAIRVGAAGVGMAQAGQSGEQLYDKVKAMRKSGKTWKEIAGEPEVWVDVVGVIAGAVGSAGGFAKEGSELAKTLTGLGHAATGTQLATLGAAIYVTNTDPSLSDAEKANRISDFASTFLVTGAIAINGKYGKNFEAAWNREIQQETGQKMLPPGPEPPKELPAGPEPAKQLPAGPEPPKMLPVGPEPSKQLPPRPEPPKLLAPSSSPREQIQSEGSWESLKKQAATDPEAQQRLHAARMEIHAEARQALAEKYPSVEWEQLGASTKMSNDADVTMKPKLPPNPTPQDIAKAVALSGEAAEFARGKLRDAVKGDPGAAIDTNIYTYTGSEAAIDIPKAQQAAVALKLDAAGLAAMKESMTPAEWADFKQRALEKAQPSDSKPNEVGPAQFEFERRARADMEARLDEAEKTTADIEDAKTRTRENLVKEHPELKNNQALLDGLTRDKAADTFRAELVEALNKGDMSHARELQTKIKMVEEGAYVTPAAYENVVQAQQRMSRGESKFESLSTDPHENAQAAADIYAQMKKHADAGSLMDRLKSVAKNRARLELEAARPGDIPYIEENFSQSRMKDNYNQLYAGEGEKVANDDKAALRKMVTDWAQTTPDKFSPELAESFIQAQLKSGLDVVLGLQTASAGLRGYETPSAGPQKPPSFRSDNPPSGGGKEGGGGKGKGPTPPKGPGGGEGENNGPPPEKGPHKARTKIPVHDMSEFKSAAKVADLIRQTGGKDSPLYKALEKREVVKIRGEVAERISFEALKQIYPNQMPLEELVDAPPPAKGKRPPSTILRNIEIVDLGVPAKEQTVTEIDALVLQQHKRGFEVAMIEQVKSSNEAGDAITQSYRSMNYLRAAQENPNIRFRIGGVNGQDITSILLDASTENALLVARLPSDDAHGQYDKATGRGRFQDPPLSEGETKNIEPKPSLRRQARIENLGANRGDIDKAVDEMLKHRDEILKYFEGEGN